MGVGNEKLYAKRAYLCLEMPENKPCGGGFQRAGNLAVVAVSSTSQDSPAQISCETGVEPCKQ